MVLLLFTNLLLDKQDTSLKVLYLLFIYTTIAIFSNFAILTTIEEEWRKQEQGWALDMQLGAGLGNDTSKTVFYVTRRKPMYFT